MASALFDVITGLQLTDNRGFFSANGNVIVNALTTSSGLYWTGNGKSISGIAITASATPPTSPPPSIGDQWYNTSNDVVYQYQFDGTSTYWVDISSTVITANANTSPIDTVITDSIKANVGAYQTWANGRIATIDANLGLRFTTLNSLHANVGAYQTWANLNLAAEANVGTLYLGNIATNANLGAYQIWANANVSSLQTQIDALAPASIDAFQTYANTKIGTNTNGNLVVVATTASTSNQTGALVVGGGVGITGDLNLYNPTASGYFANIAAFGRPSTGVQSWRFWVNDSLGGPNSYMQFPDGTNQFTAYPGTSTSLSTFDANLGTLFLGNISTQANLGTATVDISNIVTQANANTAAYLTTYTGNVSAGNLSVGNIAASGNLRVDNYSNLFMASGTADNQAQLNIVGNVTGKSGAGAGYHDFMMVQSTNSAISNAQKWFRMNQNGGLEIVNSTFTTTLFNLNDGGDLVLNGNVAQNGIRPFYSANRPAFRVYGSGTTNDLTPTQNTTGALNSNNWTVDFNQGSYLNGTTGVFTAPVAGLYQTNMVGRFAGNTTSISQLAVIKNATGGNGSGGTVQTFLEFAASSTMIHAGASAVVSMNPGDTLALKVLAGTINFDSNDHWSVAYIG